MEARTCLPINFPFQSIRQQLQPHGAPLPFRAPETDRISSPVYSIRSTHASRQTINTLAIHHRLISQFGLPKLKGAPIAADQRFRPEEKHCLAHVCRVCAHKKKKCISSSTTPNFDGSHLVEGLDGSDQIIEIPDACANIFSWLNGSCSARSRVTVIGKQIP